MELAAKRRRPGRCVGRKARVLFGAAFAVFDLDEVDDPAAFGDPHHYAKGVRHVLVGGVFVVLQGEGTGARPGRALRRRNDSRRR